MDNSLINISQIDNIHDIDPVQWFNIILNDGAIIQDKEQEDNMTDNQYDGILHMIEMILDGCKDINEAKKKIAELRLKHSDEVSKPSKSETN